MASEYTTNFNLDKYVGTDKPNLRDQYNSAMDKIDAQLKISSDNAALAVQTANNAASAVSGKAEQSALNAEISARENADTGLQTAINNEVTARQNADNALDARLNSLEEQGYMVIIGDSFSSASQSGTPLWYTYVASHYGLTPYTTASDGMGFSIGANKFITQINNAITAMSGKKVERVYLLGGLNDTRDSSYNTDTVRETVWPCLDAMKNAWPDAKIAVYGPESFPQINANNKLLAGWMAWYCHERQIEYHDLTVTFQPFNGFFGGKTGTNPHPSAEGQKLIASCIINHGYLARANWTPSFVPTNMDSYSAQAASIVITDGSGTIGNNVITTQNLVFNDNIVRYECVIDATKIPNTVNRIGLHLPYNLEASVIDGDNIVFSDAYISQLYANAVCSGWWSHSAGFQFNINNDYPIQTGNAKPNIRITVTMIGR